MKSSASFLPIGIAILAVGAVGWLSKRKAPVLDRAPSAPIVIKIERTGEGSGSPSEKLNALRNSPAAWVSYRSFENGKLRDPIKAHYRLRFVVTDEKGLDWPVEPCHSAKTSYICIPGGYPFQPKQLTLSVFFADNKLAEWSLPPVAPPRRRLKRMSVQIPSYRGWTFQPSVTLFESMATVSYQPIRPRVKDSSSRLQIDLKGHSFGLNDTIYPNGPGPIRVPQRWLPYLDAVDAEVALTTFHLKTVVVPLGGQPDPEPGARNGSGNADYQLGKDIKMAFKRVDFRSIHGIVPDQPRSTYEVVFKDPVDTVCEVSEVRSRNAKVSLMRTGPELKSYINVSPLEGQPGRGPFDVSLTVRVGKTGPKETILLPLKPMKTPKRHLGVAGVSGAAL